MKARHTGDYNLEQLLRKGSFHDLEAGEREFVLRELGSQEAFECVQITLRHSGNAMAQESEEYNPAPLPAARIRRKLHRRRMEVIKEPFKEVLARAASGRRGLRLGLALACVLALLYMAAGADFFRETAAPGNVEVADTINNDTKIEQRRGAYADSGKEHSLDSIISLFEETQAAPEKPDGGMRTCLLTVSAAAKSKSLLSAVEQGSPEEPGGIHYRWRAVPSIAVVGRCATDFRRNLHEPGMLRLQVAPSSRRGSAGHLPFNIRRSLA